MPDNQQHEKIKEQIVLKSLALKSLGERKKRIEAQEKKLRAEIKELIAHTYGETKSVNVEKTMGDRAITVKSTRVAKISFVSDAPLYIRQRIEDKDLVERLIVESVHQKEFEQAVKDGEIDADFAASIIIDNSYSKLTIVDKKAYTEDDEDGFD